MNLTAAFYGANGSDAGMSSFGLGYRGMCRSVSFFETAVYLHLQDI